MDLLRKQKSIFYRHLVSSYRREYCMRMNKLFSVMGWKLSYSVRRSEAQHTTHDASFIPGERITFRQCKSCYIPGKRRGNFLRLLHIAPGDYIKLTLKLILSFKIEINYHPRFDFLRSLSSGKRELHCLTHAAIE
jgi:hypothetical protein